MKKNIALAFFFLAITACKKNEEKAVVYQGEVVRGITECNTPSGFPYIIKYVDSNNKSDSLITSSLPSDLKFAGLKISFKMYNTIVNSEVMICTQNIIPPVQKSLYDVK